MKTFKILALSAALVIPVTGFVASSQLDKANASDTHLNDEQFFATHYQGLTKNEVATYVDYLEEIEKLNMKIDHLITEDGKVLAKDRAQHKQLNAERDRLDKEVHFLETKSFFVEEKERINGLKNVEEKLRQSLLDHVTTILNLEEKSAKSALTAAEKEQLDRAYRAYNGDIFFFDKSEEIEQLDGLTKEEKSELLKSYLKINELNQKVANLTYDEYYQIVSEDQETYQTLDAEITAIYKKEIIPLEKKAGLESSYEPLQW